MVLSSGKNFGFFGFGGHVTELKAIKMSAFTPYKKIEEATDLRMKKDTIANGLPKVPLDLTTKLLFHLPNLHKNVFNIGSLSAGRTNNENSEKNEKFYIKNLLKSEESAEKKSERKRLEFEEQASKMETIVSNLGKLDNGHKCIYCGKVYSRKYGLKIHIRTHTGYKPLKCKYCLRPFGDPSNLNKHVRLHTRGHTPYNCQFCGKVLVRRRDLERHVKSKHGEPS